MIAAAPERLWQAPRMGNLAKCLGVVCLLAAVLLGCYALALAGELDMEDDILTAAPVLGFGAAGLALGTLGVVALAVGGLVDGPARQN